MSSNFLIELTVTGLKNLRNLRTLSLKNNNILSFFKDKPRDGFSHDLLDLDLSEVRIHSLDLNIFSPFKNLQTLNMSGSGVVTVVSDLLTPLLRALRKLDVTGCPFEQFPSTMFKAMSQLQYLNGDTYRICCPAVLPDHMNPSRRVNHDDDISSCSNLLD
jgi:Leucine-rich repeat (LRR) protein